MSRAAERYGAGLRRAMVWGVDVGFRRLARPVIFRASAQQAHERMKVWLRLADDWPVASVLAALAGQVGQVHHPVMVGGVRLSSPFILAAGLVKGDGFESENEALRAVEAGRNIIPGWKSIPRMAGLVEFGSFTRWPRLGNPGTVVWRDAATRSTQNRVGLRNPGVQAAASFLAARRDRLPAQYGLNIAVSPGVDDPAQQADEVVFGLATFVEQGVLPGWFTLNLSCPNTEDDPGGHQTAGQARIVCGAAADYLRRHAGDRPLWVKLSPALGDEQYVALMTVLSEVGARAVIATNTLGQPAPGQPHLSAGIGGGRLYAHALAAAGQLMRARQVLGSAVDVIGCGGVLDGSSFLAYRAMGIQAVQYWSALVFRGPLAAAIMAREAGMR